MSNTSTATGMMVAASGTVAEESSWEAKEIPGPSGPTSAHSEIIFGAGEQAFLAAIYGATLVLGLLSNAAMIWVILGELLHPFQIFTL